MTSFMREWVILPCFNGNKHCEPGKGARFSNFCLVISNSRYKKQTKNKQ
jgi:hypothetical protein